MAFCALAVAALAIGPFLYRSMLPTPSGEPVATCSFLFITGGLFVLFAAAAIWLLQRSRRSRRPESDRGLREAVMGGNETPPSRTGGASQIDG